MTISSTTRKTLPYVGDGTSTVFAFEFKVFTTADIYAVELDTDTDEETVLVLGSGFTATLNPNQDTDPGGEITLALPLAIGKQLVISSDIQPLQQTDLTNQGGFYPSVITKALDKLTILVQQLVENIGRTLKLPITVSSDVSAAMPSPVANGVFKWNDAADAIESVTLAGIVPGTVPVTTYAATYLDDSTAIATRTTLGLAEVGVPNALINGSLNILRDPTINNHFPTASAISYLLQRWYNYQVGGVTGNMSISQITGPGGAYPNAVRIARNVGATITDSRFKTVLPSAVARQFAGKALTFRFWARKGSGYSATGANIIPSISSGTGTDQSAASNESGAWTGQTNVLGSNQPITSSWVEYSLITAPLPANCNQLAIGFFFAWSGVAPANDYVDIAGIRVAASGVSDIPIFDPPADLDEQRCLEFFETIGDGNTFHNLAAGFLVGTQTAWFNLSYARKRARPALTVSAAADFYVANSAANDAGTAITFASSCIGKDRARMEVQFATPRTVGQGANLCAANTANMRVYVDAEF